MYFLYIVILQFPFPYGEYITRNLKYETLLKRNVSKNFYPINLI